MTILLKFVLYTFINSTVNSNVPTKDVNIITLDTLCVTIITNYAEGTSANNENRVWVQKADQKVAVAVGRRSFKSLDLCNQSSDEMKTGLFPWCSHNT